MATGFDDVTLLGLQHVVFGTVVGYLLCMCMVLIGDDDA